MVREIFSVLLLFFSISSASADSQVFINTIKGQLSNRFPGSRIDLGANGRWSRGTPIQDILSIEFISEPAPGEAVFQIRGAEGFTSEWTAPFRAMTSVYIAVRRIRPGERLTTENVQVKEIDAAHGIVRDFRSLLVLPSVDITRLESKQTFLEGQYLTLSSVDRIPDVRRGDSIQIRLTSPGIVMSTSGIIQEPGRYGDKVRILTRTTKREVTGKLLENGTAEVTL